MYQPAEPEASHRSHNKNLGVFSGLATEVIIKILSNVSWKDLVSIRQACKFFDGVSRTRSLWENLVQQYSTPTRNSPRSLRLELPMSMYTSAELEQQITRWKKSQLAWRQGKVYKRHTIMEDLRSYKVHLVKGGRWLLRIVADGSVVCHDLDNRTTEPVTLIPSAHSRGAWICRPVAIEEIDDAPSLTIRLALVYTLAPENPQERIDIWSAHLIADGPQQTDAAFTLELCSSFTLPANLTPVHLVSLLGESIAFLFTCSLTKMSFLAVVNWVNGKWKNNGYPRRYISSIRHDMLHFSLLSRNRIFAVLDDDQLVLWSFEGSKETTDAPNLDSPDGQLLWSGYLQASGPDYKIPGPFVCAGSTRFVISCSSEIVGVVIPNNHPEKTTTIKIMDLTNNDQLVIQPSYHWTACFEAMVTSAITFRWPDEDGDPLSTPISADNLNAFCPAGVVELSSLSPLRIFKMLFDEQSGCIVTKTTVTSTIQISDTLTK